jgi:hypothetical protein
MNEYRFQYTKIQDTLLVLLVSILSFVFSIYVFVKMYSESSKNMLLLFSILSIIVAIFLFRYIKKFAVRNCIAKLNTDSVVFEFKNDLIRTIYFNHLTSYKVYYGNNGPVLYLRNNIDHFKIFANDNFCKSEPFVVFCKDILVKIDNYFIENKSAIIHEGSVFQTKGMLLFLTFSTPIVLLLIYITTTDLIEIDDLNLFIRSFGGVFLFVFWFKYIIEKYRKNK